MRALWLAAALAAAACVPASEPRPAASGATGPVDTARHSVPLDDIHFDTFDGGSVPLSRVTAEQVARLRDAIPPLDRPRYDAAAAGSWLEPTDLVLGYVGERGSALAYPHKIMNFHEIVNDEIDGVPVLVSYCPLCRSGIVYDRRLDGRVFTFGNTSALYESDLVMYDRETGSYWWQVAGRAIVGPLTDRALRPLPSMTMPWSAWTALHPDTKVLSRETGFRRNYASDPFVSLTDQLNAQRFPFPVSDAVRDARLAPGEVVLGVSVGGESVAFPVERYGDAALNETVGGTPVVVLVRADGTAAAFAATLDGRRLTFALREGAFVDEQSGTRWDPGGTAVDGPLRGRRLEPIASRSTFWFAYVAAFPETRVRR